MRVGGLPRNPRDVENKSEEGIRECFPEEVAFWAAI